MDNFKEEQLIIDYFREVYDNFPKGKLIKTESPDFILKCNLKKSIGIELTRLDQEVHSLKEKIITSIAKKDLKYKSYRRKRFTSVWLIIHADSIEDTKSYNIENKMINWVFKSKFNKVNSSRIY